jgi:hypothetical protein
MPKLIVGSCGCAVTVHAANCEYHEHDWKRDYYYDDNPSDSLIWCSVCHKSKSLIRQEESDRRALHERERLGQQDGWV